MFKVMFTGRTAFPRLLLEEPFSTIEHAERIAKQAAAAIVPNYYWCGIYDAEDQLVKEFSFTPTVIYA